MKPFVKWEKKKGRLIKREEQAEPLQAPGQETLQEQRVGGLGRETGLEAQLSHMTRDPLYAQL